MPTAILEPEVFHTDDSYRVVSFRVVPVKDDWGTPSYADWPADFRAITLPGLSSWLTVSLRLSKDESGIDKTRMFVACDYLRDHGWTVDARGWCKSALAHMEGRPAA